MEAEGNGLHRGSSVVQMVFAEVHAQNETVGLAIICITKHRLGSKGGPTTLCGKPTYKHKYSIIKTDP